MDLLVYDPPSTFSLAPCPEPIVPPPRLVPREMAAWLAALSRWVELAAEGGRESPA